MGLIINILLLKNQITVAAVSATPWPTETWLLAPLAYPFLNYGYEKKKKNSVQVWQEKKLALSQLVSVYLTVSVFFIKSLLRSSNIFPIS